MSDFIADRHDLADSGQESRLRVLCAAEAGTRLLLGIRSEQNSWQLSEIQVVDDAERVCTSGTPRKIRESVWRSPSGTAASILDAAESPNRAR